MFYNYSSCKNNFLNKSLNLIYVFCGNNIRVYFKYFVEIVVGFLQVECIYYILLYLSIERLDWSNRYIGWREIGFLWSYCLQGYVLLFDFSIFVYWVFLVLYRYIDEKKSCGFFLYVMEDVVGWIGMEEKQLYCFLCFLQFVVGKWLDRDLRKRGYFLNFGLVAFVMIECMDKWQ